MAGVAKLWKPVINVTDLNEGERFWSAVSGLTPRGRHGQFSVLDADDPSGGDGWILLQHVPANQEPGRSGMHVDFRVEDVAQAVEQVEAIGGSVVRAPGFYAPDGRDLLEWAVMCDPFGNDFCLIRWPLD